MLLSFIPDSLLDNAYSNMENNTRLQMKSFIVSNLQLLTIFFLVLYSVSTECCLSFFTGNFQFL